MKKSDLRATLGSLHARDEQISRVMENVAARKQKAEKRSAMSRLNFGMSLAAAACALMIVVGLGVNAFMGGLFNEPDAVDYGVQRANEENTEITDTEKDNSHDPADEKSALEVLLAESEKIDGDWAIIRGTANAFYFAGGEADDGSYRCIIAVSVEKTEKTSDGIVINESEIVADITFADDEELNRFTDNLSSSIEILIEKNGADHDAAWTVKKIIY